MKIKKAIVLAAGKGRRLRPLTLALPKEMIRVGTKPVIEHVLEVVKAGGVKKVLIIVGRKKESIMDYIGSGERFGLQVYYRVQEEPVGTAHAVQLGEDFVGKDEFMVIYGDNYIKPYENIREIMDFHKKRNSDATLVLHPVGDPRRFGIVKIDRKNKVIKIVEKPSLREAKKYMVDGKYLNIAGILMFKPCVFKYIKKTKPGKNGEIWLTDSVELMRRDGKKVYAFLFRGTRYDIGTFDSLIEADKAERKLGM